MSGGPFGEIALAARAVRHRGDPALAPRPRLDAIQAPVDQDAREPDFEGELFAKRLQVRIRLDERILHRLVRLRGVAEVMERDPGRATLVPGHQLGIPLPRISVPPFGLRCLDGRSRRAVRFAAGDPAALAPAINYALRHQTFTGHHYRGSVARLRGCENAANRSGAGASARVRVRLRAAAVPVWRLGLQPQGCCQCAQLDRRIHDHPRVSGGSCHRGLVRGAAVVSVPVHDRPQARALYRAGA